MTPEGKIKVLILHVLNKHSAWIHMPVPTGFQGKTVDFLACCKGRFIAIEAKRPGKDATPRQSYILELIRGAGGLTFVIDNEKGVQNLDKTLEELPWMLHPLPTGA
jgi:hypothetical protein